MKNTNYNYKECVGKTFGSLLIKSYKTGGSGASFEVLCQPCGKTFIIKASRVLNGSNISCGCQRRVATIKRNQEGRLDLLGKTFGKLTVLSVDEQKIGASSVYWKCRCECGKLKSIKGHHLAEGNVVSCGCIMRGKSNKKWKGYEEISGKFFYRIKKGAISRNHSFDLKIEDIWNLFLKQNRKCALSGLPIKFPSIVGATDGNASLDRIDNTKGYFLENVQWIDKNINFLKQDFTEEMLLRYCTLLVENKKTQKVNAGFHDYVI